MAAPSTAPARPPALHSVGGGSDPFAPDANYFFQESSRVQRLDLLYSLLYYGRSVPVLSGPPGSGKTTLLLQLQKKMGRTHPTALLTAYPELVAESLLDEAQRQFNVALAAGGLEGAMEAVLLVDDADTLPDTVLQVLLTPSSGQGSGQIRVLIAGTPALGTRIASFPDTIPIARVLELLPFAEEDTIRFVCARMKMAGILSHPLLLPAALKQLHWESGGWPGAIVTRAQAALAPTTARLTGKTSKAAPRKKPAKPTRLGVNRLGSRLLRTTRQAIRSHWLWPVVGVATVAILFGLWPKGGPPTFPPAVVSTLPPTREIPQSLPRAPEPGGASNVAVVHESPIPPPTVEPSGLHPTHPTRETVASLVPSIPVTSIVPVPIPPVTSTAARMVPPAQVQVPTASTGSGTPHPLPAVLPTSPQQTVTAPVSPPTPTPVAPGNLQPEEWLRTQPSNNYTLQLMSGNSEAPLQEFLHRWKLTGQMVIARTRRSGRDWYALLYGTYSNSRQAQEAIKQLPHDIGKPWARTFGSVQQDLQQPNPPKR